jgi:hypothetical protein
MQSISESAELKPSSIISDTGVHADSKIIIESLILPFSVPLSASDLVLNLGGTDLAASQMTQQSDLFSLTPSVKAISEMCFRATKFSGTICRDSTVLLMNSMELLQSPSLIALVPDNPQSSTSLTFIRSLLNWNQSLPYVRSKTLIYSTLLCDSIRVLNSKRSISESVELKPSDIFSGSVNDLNSGNCPRTLLGNSVKVRHSIVWVASSRDARTLVQMVSRSIMNSKLLSVSSLLPGSIGKAISNLANSIQFRSEGWHSNLFRPSRFQPSDPITSQDSRIAFKLSFPSSTADTIPYRLVSLLKPSSSSTVRSALNEKEKIIGIVSGSFAMLILLALLLLFIGLKRRSRTSENTLDSGDPIDLTDSPEPTVPDLDCIMTNLDFATNEAPDSEYDHIE